MIRLTGEARERAHIGCGIIKKFYQETNLTETLNKLREVLKTVEFMKSKKENCDIDDVIDIIMYAQSYATNTKDWKTT